MSKTTDYIASRMDWPHAETGLSSDAMLREALGGRDVADLEFPSDWADLHRCSLAIQRAPRSLRRKMHGRMWMYRTHVRARYGVKLS